MKRLAWLSVLVAAGAHAATFTVTLTNTGTNAAYGWSAGLLTLQPLIAIGPSPQPPSNQYFTYSFANSNCTITDSFCSGACNDNGNATVLAQRWGLTLGVNAWLVPAIAANGGSATVTFDAPVGSSLSYIAWVNNTSVFDDFVAMHPPGNATTLSVPLFNGSTPVENVDFVIGAYDVNSTSPTDGSGTTCSPECPAPATGCFVAPGNASQGGGGTFPTPPTPNVRTFTASTSVGQNRLWWTNVGPHQGVAIARSASAVTWTPTNGVSYTAGQQVGAVAATGTVTTATRNQIADGSLFTLGDGTNAVVTFEFDRDNPANIGAGRTRIDISTNGLSASQVGDRMVTAINGVGAPLRVTATKAAAQPYVTLLNDFTGTQGNVAMTETVTNNNFVVSGMAGGGNAQATIVYFDNGGSAAASFSDPGVTAGTRYFYKVFSHANALQYANGAVPSSTGLFSEVTSSSGATPRWCYSVGSPALTQPVTTLGQSVFTTNGFGAVTANVTSPGSPTTDGNERWRPVQLNGANQSRPLMVPTQAGQLLITGDFSGRVTAINPSSGAVVWQTGVLGSRVQAQPVAQLLAFVGSFGAAGTAFANANPGRDLIFVGTRNTGSTTNNQVFALNSTNGATVWTYTPGNLDYISGGMAVDYANNRLYVGAHNGLRVLSTLNGTQVASLLAGQQLDYGVNLDFTGGAATSVYTVSVGGTAYGISLATMAQTFSATIGATSSWIFPTGNGFVASMASGEIRRYAVSGATATQVWARTGIGIPAGATIDYAGSKIYAGCSDGTLRQIDFNDGGLDRTFTVTTTAPLQVGFPTLDTTVGRLHVGTMDGRVCAFPIPLP